MISIPGRIPVHIYPFFWILIALIGWMNSASLSGKVLTPITGTLIWMVVIFFSVLIHEYGHALAALLFGQKSEINLVGLGGLTKREGGKLGGWKEFLIVFNGPFVGLLLFAVAYTLLENGDGYPIFVLYALQVAVQVNLFWTLLNLLPVLPLDGGQLLRIVLEGVFGVRGLKAAILISISLALAAGGYFFVIQQIFMGSLFFLLAFESYKTWDEIKKLTPHDLKPELVQKIQEGVDDLQAGNLNEALAKFSFVREEAPKGMLYVSASQYGARVLAEQGNYKMAYLWLYPLKSRLTVDYLVLLQQLAYRLQEWEEAVKAGEQAYQQEPMIDTALLNSFAYAIMGQATPAVGWLRSAANLGMPDVKKVIAKREFDMIRNSDPFQKFLSSI